MKNKKNKNKRNILNTLLIVITCFFITSIIYYLKKDYNYIDMPFKNMTSYINTFFIKKIYKREKIDDNIIKSKIKYLEKENNELRKIIDFKKTNLNYIAAEVVNRNFTIINKKIEINKGNLKLNMPVINENGLVGFISKTNKNISEVNLITNVEENKLSVLINNNISGILSKYNNKKNIFQIVDVISKDEIKKGDIVTLSYYNNEMYKGILLGYVESFSIDNYGLSKIVNVKSNVDFNNLMYVLVEAEK